MLNFAVKSGLLPESHILYETVTAFLLKGFDLLSDSQLKDFPVLLAYASALKFNFGSSAVHFFNGVGNYGTNGSTQTASEFFQTHNFFSPSLSTITNHAPAPDYEGHMVLVDILSFYRFHFPFSLPLPVHSPLTPLSLRTHFAPTSHPLPTHFPPTSRPLPAHFPPTSRPLPAHFPPTSLPLPSHFYFPLTHFPFQHPLLPTYFLSIIDAALIEELSLLM
jgi:hypothetical protein